MEIVVVFLWNDLSALMLTLGAADFSRRTKVLRFRPQAYLHKTPSIIPQPQDKIKPPPKKPAGANHQPIPLHQLRLRRTDHPLLRTEVVFHVPLKISVKRRGVQVVEESLMVNNTFTQITIKTDDDKTGFSESSAPGSCRSAWGCRSKETSPPHHVHHKRTECR